MKDDGTIHNSDWVWSAPLITTGLIIFAFGLFYKVFLFCSPGDAPCSVLKSELLRAGVSNSNETRALIYLARATWTLVNGIHAIACVAALFTAIMIMNQALKDHAKRVRWIVIALGIAANVSLLSSLMASFDTGSPAPQLLRATVGQDLNAIMIYIRSFDALSLTVALSLCFATSALLWPSKMAPDDVEQAAKEVKRRLTLLRYLLYVGAVLLVIGVLRQSTNLGWAASYFPPNSEVGKSVGPLVKGIVSSLGVFYTLLMAGMYFPAGLVLRARARALAEQALAERALAEPAPARALAEAGELEQTKTETDPETWLSNRGLTLSYAAWLPRLAAILAPLIAGPLFEIIGKLAGATVVPG